MRSFNNVAKLIREKRLTHPKRLSQAELSCLLGYKNGQFISNVERGLCSIPVKMLNRVSEVLEIDKSELKTMILKDFEDTLDSYFVDQAKEEQKTTPETISVTL
jgi:transcriptional regulator with XRE-family HTH domain